MEIEVEGTEILFPADKDIDNFSRFGQSVLAGLGCNIPFNEKLSIDLTLRGDLGYVEAGKGELVLFGKNRSLVLLAGARF